MKPSRLWIGVFLFLAGFSVLSGFEAHVLRREIMRMGAARYGVLGRKLPDGRLVKDAIIPGTMLIIRDESGYLACGRTQVVPR